MYCPFCGTDNPEDRKFCLACGTPLEVEMKHESEMKKESKDLHLRIVRQTEDKVPEKTKAEEAVVDQKLSVDASEQKEKVEQKQQIHRSIERKETSLTIPTEKEDILSQKIESKNELSIKKEENHAIAKKETVKLGAEEPKADRPVSHEHKITRQINVEHDAKEQEEKDISISTPKNLYKNLPDEKKELGELTMTQTKAVETKQEKEKNTLSPKPENQKQKEIMTPVKAASTPKTDSVDQKKKEPVLTNELGNNNHSKTTEATIKPALEHEKKQPEKKEVFQKKKESPMREEEPKVNLIEKEENGNRGVLLGEEEPYLQQDEPFLLGLPKKKVMIIAVAAAVWILLVVVGSLFYLSNSSPAQLTDDQPKEVVFNEVSDFRQKVKDSTVELTWIWNTNEVKIVDQILEIYDLEGKLIKQMNLGPDLFGYTLSGLERGVEYRVVLRLKSDDGRLSGGKSIFVTIPLNYDMTRKQDLEELKAALTAYFEAKGYYPKSQNYASLLNTLIKEKLIKRRIKDPEYPEHEYTYKSMWDGQSYELKIYLSDLEDELFNGMAPKDQIYIYNPANEKDALDILRAEE